MFAPTQLVGVWQDYMALLTEHDLIVRRALARWSGREVKHTGDGFMVVFEMIGDSLTWAQDLVAEFARQSPWAAPDLAPCRG